MKCSFINAKIKVKIVYRFFRESFPSETKRKIIHEKSQS